MNQLDKMKEELYIKDILLKIFMSLNAVFEPKKISRIIMDINKLLASKNLDFILQQTTYEYKIHEMKKLLIFEKHKDEYGDLEADNIHMRIIKHLEDMNFQGYRPDKVTEDEQYTIETYDIYLKPIANLYHKLGYAELDETGKQFVYKVDYFK
jgi:hypothetical protein